MNTLFTNNFRVLVTKKRLKSRMTQTDSLQKKSKEWSRMLKTLLKKIRRSLELENWIQEVKHGQKWSDVVRNGLQWSKRILLGHILAIKRSLTDPNRSKITQKVLFCIFSTYFVLIYCIFIENNAVWLMYDVNYESSMKRENVVVEKDKLSWEKRV